MDKLQHIKKMIATLQNEGKLNAHQRVLLDMYIKKKETMEKQQ